MSSEYNSGIWVTIETDIDFRKYKPISISSSLHIDQYKYKIGGRIYRVLYPIGGGEPLIEVLDLSKNYK